tara:strand:- start:12704 stop:13078 length:375 start_codon:yes stop_codon:yes gene_type:complete
MANRNANAAEKQWLKDITSFIDDVGIEIFYKGWENSAYQRHHVVGKSGKHNKVHIGYWFVNPIPWQLHDVNSNHPLNVTHHKHAFREKYGDERSIYQCLVSCIAQCGYAIPPDDVYNAIMDTNA